MPSSFWMQLALAVIIAILALLNASANQNSMGGAIAFLIFLAAVGYAFLTIKRAFDRIDSERHRDRDRDSE